MLSYTDLKKGLLIVYEGQPYEILSADFLRMQQRKAVVQTQIKNLISCKVLDRNFQPSDSFEEAEIESYSAKYLYNHRGEYWFSDESNQKNRFKLSESVMSDGVQFLKANTIVQLIKFKDNVISVKLPIKIDLKVKESPPALRGDTAQGGTKSVELETGAKLNVPLFVNEGDVIKVNTETGQYVERVSKSA